MPVLLQCYSGEVQPTDQEAIATEETFCTVEEHTTHVGPHEEAPGLVRRQKEHVENSGKSIYCGFQGGMGHTGGANRLKTASASHFSGLWGSPELSGTSLEVIRADGWWPRV